MNTDTEQSIKDCVAFLRHFNKWRRGDEELQMPEPRDIGVNIDQAASDLERLQKQVKLLSDLVRYAADRREEVYYPQWDKFILLRLDQILAMKGVDEP